MSDPIALSLTQKATSGVAWSMAFQIGRQLLSFASVLVLARKVPPSAYGLIGMATAVTNFIEIFRDLGTGAAIIREKEVSNRLLSSVFWLNLTLGFLLFLGVVLLAFPAALFFHQPRLVPVMQALAAVFLFSSISVVPNGLLVREMTFRPIAIAQLTGAAIGTTVAIVAALLGAGVWSLVLSALVSGFVTAVSLWWACPWRPQLVVDWGEMRSIASYSLHLSGFNFVNYFSRNADNLVVGRFLGAVALGYYQMAYTLMTYPLSNLSSVIASVVFPALSTLQKDDARFRSAFKRVCTLVGLVTIPAMLGLAVVAGPLVAVALGARWGPVASLLVVFAPLGMLQSIFTIVGTIYNAKGRADLLLRWGLFSGSVYVVSFFLGLPWGILGVAISYTIAWVVLMVPGFTIPFRLIGLSWSEFLSPLWPVLVAGISMMLVTFVWLHSLPAMGVTNLMLQLVTTVAIGCVVYGGVLLWWKPPAVGELATVLEDNGYLRLARRLSKNS